MRNLPKKIYLQIGGSDVTIDKSTTDWNDLFHGAVTWADHRIYDNDIEFILSDVSGNLSIDDLHFELRTIFFDKMKEHWVDDDMIHMDYVSDAFDETILMFLEDCL